MTEVDRHNDLSALNKSLFDAIEQSKSQQHERWRDIVIETLTEINNEEKRKSDCRLIQGLPREKQNELARRMQEKGIQLYDPVSCGKNGDAESSGSTPAGSAGEQALQSPIPDIIKRLEESGKNSRISGWSLQQRFKNPNG